MDLDLYKLAKLSRMSLSLDEESEFGPQIEAILHHVRSLQSVDVSALEQSSRDSPSLPLREDSASPETLVTTKQSLVELSPGHMNGYFEVPQVVVQ